MAESRCRELAYECLRLAGLATDEQFRRHYQKLAAIGLALWAAEREDKSPHSEASRQPVEPGLIGHVVHETPAIIATSDVRSEVEAPATPLVAA